MTEPVVTLNESLDGEEVADLKIRYTISAALNRNNLVEILRNIVDDSSIIDFETGRARKFILGERPELNLVIDLEKAKEKYPELPESSLYLEEHARREEIVRREIEAEIINFFAAIFFYIRDGQLADTLQSQLPRVEKILEGRDIEELKKTIKNIIIEEVDDVENFTFHFSIFAALRFAEEEAIFEDNTFLMEILY